MKNYSIPPCLQRVISFHPHIVNRTDVAIGDAAFQGFGAWFLEQVGCSRGLSVRASQFNSMDLNTSEMDHFFDDPGHPHFHFKYPYMTNSFTAHLKNAVRMDLCSPRDIFEHADVLCSEWTGNLAISWHDYETHFSFPDGHIHFLRVVEHFGALLSPNNLELVSSLRQSLESRTFRFSTDPSFLLLSPDASSKESVLKSPKQVAVTQKAPVVQNARALASTLSFDGDVEKAVPHRSLPRKGAVRNPLPRSSNPEDVGQDERPAVAAGGNSRKRGSLTSSAYHGSQVQLLEPPQLQGLMHHLPLLVHGIGVLPDVSALAKEALLTILLKHAELPSFLCTFCYAPSEETLEECLCCGLQAKYHKSCLAVFWQAQFETSRAQQNMCRECLYGLQCRQSITSSTALLALSCVTHEASDYFGAIDFGPALGALDGLSESGDDEILRVMSSFPIWKAITDLRSYMHNKQSGNNVGKGRWGLRVPFKFFTDTEVDVYRHIIGTRRFCSTYKIKLLHKNDYSLMGASSRVYPATQHHPNAKVASGVDKMVVNVVDRLAEFHYFPGLLLKYSIEKGCCGFPRGEAVSGDVLGQYTGIVNFVTRSIQATYFTDDDKACSFNLQLSDPYCEFIERNPTLALTLQSRHPNRYQDDVFEGGIVMGLNEGIDDVDDNCYCLPLSTSQEPDVRLYIVAHDESSNKPINVNRELLWDYGNMYPVTYPPVAPLRLCDTVCAGSQQFIDADGGYYVITSVHRVYFSFFLFFHLYCVFLKS